MLLSAPQGYRALPPERRMRLDYERRCADPGPEIARLVRFLGPEPSPDWLARVARIPEQRPPRWHSLLPKAQGARSRATETAREALAALPPD